MCHDNSSLDESNQLKDGELARRTDLVLDLCNTFLCLHKYVRDITMVGLVIYEKLGVTNKTDSCEDRDNTGKKMQRAAEMTILTRIRFPEWLPPLITRTGRLPW